MHFTTIAAALIPAVAVYAADITIAVGANNGLVFDPPSVTAQLNDNLIFQFMSKNHSVTQSTFANPCTKSGIDSGFQAVTPGNVPQWNVTVNDPTTPLWMFCAQTNPANHCQAGMVFAVNPPADKTFDMFQAAAKALAATSGASSAAPGASGSAGASGVSGAAGATGGVSGASSAGVPAATGASGVSGASSTSAGASSTGSSTSPAASSTGNSAARMGGSAAGVLGVVGLFAGLLL
ncbi:hypothetical protein BDQ12DRAFT_676030 [Crucibulum laeve]|uniref:Cupredoxin n=1 Tax=Crucibulum laeve TaxID=68775 RepID=A0A5C3MBQ1_9AGAR|nr:hypothetical protein BDQ12DRAFT_676030 [Crucibulum laeve]